MSRAILLFDGRCGSCSEVASAARRESGGGLEVRSLHDVRMRAILDRHRPGWTWRPTLVLIGRDEAVTIVCGVSMVVRLFALLGPRGGWRVMRVINGRDGSTAIGDPRTMTRRAALRAAGGTVLAVAGLAITDGTAWARSDPGGGPIGGDELEALTTRALDSPHGREAVATIRQAGYRTERESLAATAFHADAGGTVLLLAFASSARPESAAAVMIREVQADGESITKVEYVSDGAAPGQAPAPPTDPDTGLSPLTVDAGPRFATPGASLGGRQRRGFKQYFSCMTTCVGVSCSKQVSKCNKIPSMQLKIGCIVAACGWKSGDCHKTCRTQL